MKKVMKANTVTTKKPDNNCQTTARIKALCPRNGYCVSAVRKVERDGQRKGVSAEDAKENPVRVPATHIHVPACMYSHQIHNYPCMFLQLPEETIGNFDESTMVLNKRGNDGKDEVS